MDKKKKVRRAKWYLTYLGCCPICGKNKGYKEAQYSSPPKKHLRYYQLSDQECYDWCEG